MRIGTAATLICLLVFAAACDETTDATNDDDNDNHVERAPGPEHDGIYSFADECVTVDTADPESGDPVFLSVTDGGDAFGFETTDEESATRFHMKATDLGTYLLYDDEEHYLVATDDGFERTPEISSDIFTLDDDFLPGVQWELEESDRDESRFQMRHVESGNYLSTTGLADEPDNAAVVTLYDADDDECADYPSLTLDAEGDVEKTEFDDGSVYGFVETHSHILTNYGFGGAGIFHGSAFHPFGVEHALSSCEMFHGEEGRFDLLGFAFDEHGTDIEEVELVNMLDTGETPDFNHHTEGYPEFTDWPSAHDSSTHQAQYYKWIERAYRGGLRLMVQHATSNQVLCELIEGATEQPIRYPCNDMEAVDRIFEETRNMERYIDAQAGGPGEGWFRIVESPEEARDVIADGDLAIVLGIEVSNLFECLLTPPDGEARCDDQDVVDALDHYYDQGVRAIFPVHKYDNSFSPGDGHRGIIELGNFIQTGHWSNYTEDCPDNSRANFDQGDVDFGDLNEPRDDYFAEAPVDMSDFQDDPLDALLPHFSRLTGGPLEGDFCQNAGMTQLGEFLMQELMERGMIIEVDHLPQHAYERAFELLEENDYPAVGSHGTHNDGKLYELGGVSKFNFGNCNDPDNPEARLASLQHRLDLIDDADGFPAEGFGFDLNGFAGAPGPRFGDDSVCYTEQDNPVEYPFESYAGDVTFTEPRVGERTIDFNTEGMAHLGLVAELVEDVRNSGVDDEQLEPLFRSAEGYLRMWERSIERGEALAP